MFTQVIIFTSIFLLTHCLPRQQTPSPVLRRVQDLADGFGFGEPLFLTPYIKANKTKEGRQKALVEFTKFGWDMNSYAGYLTVHEGYNSNQFFWYFEPVNKTNDVDAVILWLQGGPGFSSLYGLFEENGPLALLPHGFVMNRQVTWANNYHVIYVDNPVGTGFSFTDDPRGYCTDEKCVGEQLLETMVQLYALFPEIKSHMLIIAGESYAGKYVPALGHAIHKYNSVEKDKQINLSGLVIGDGLSDPENQLVYDEYLYQLGLIDSNQAKTFQKYQEKVKQLIRAEEWEQATGAFEDLFAVMYNMTGFGFYYNYLYTEQYFKTIYFDEYVNDESYKSDMNVGNNSFHYGSEVAKHLKKDITKSVAPLLTELLDYYNVVFYNGQLDLLIPYVSTDNFLRQLNFTGSENMETAPRLQWRVGNELAGYVKHVGKMVQVLVRNAGHMVPMDQPEWALDMIDRTVRMCDRSSTNFLDDQ